VMHVKVGDDLRGAQSVKAYDDISPGKLGLITDSCGLLSLALPRRSAASELGVQEGDEISLSAASDSDNNTDNSIKSSVDNSTTATPQRQTVAAVPVGLTRREQPSHEQSLRDQQ